jgi:hypothetical protein
MAVRGYVNSSTRSDEQALALEKLALFWTETEGGSESIQFPSLHLAVPLVGRSVLAGAPNLGIGPDSYRLREVVDLDGKRVTG